MFDHDRNIATDTLCIRLVWTRQTPTLIYRKLLPRYRVGRRYFFQRSREWTNDRGALNANKMLGNFYAIFATCTRDCRNLLAIILFHRSVYKWTPGCIMSYRFADNISKIIISFSRRARVAIACARIASELGQGRFYDRSWQREHVSVAVTYLRSRNFRKISGVPQLWHVCAKSYNAREA